MAQLVLKACLNGSRTRADHPAVPITAEEIADDAVRVQAVGANAVHVHPRDSRGHQTLDSSACAEVIAAIRERSPCLPIGLTTGLWISGSAERRIDLIEKWSVFPDFVSVNLSEEGILPLCELLTDLGIGVEAGVASARDAHVFIDNELAPSCMRILIEVHPVAPADAVHEAQVIESIFEAAAVTLPQLHHGYGFATWSVIDAAGARGHDIRIGLEDTVVGRDRQVARDNADLVRAALVGRATQAT